MKQVAVVAGILGPLINPSGCWYFPSTWESQLESLPSWGKHTSFCTSAARVRPGPWLSLTGLPLPRDMNPK